MSQIKLLTVFGTRPEAIKMAPLVLELSQHHQFDNRVVVTGQHREMLDQVLAQFDIRPHYDLNVMQRKQTLFDTTTRVLQGLEEVFLREEPRLVLVHGDTTTTFAASLAAFYLKIPVGHVEAGLRSFARYFPFPEEINRRLTGVLAQLHFAPTATSRDNLLREGVEEEGIFVTGNTAIDALLTVVDPGYSFQDPALSQVDFEGYRVLVVEAHRRENWGEPMVNICRAVAKVVRDHPDLLVVFPVHPNPVVREVVEGELGGLPRVKLLSPLDYRDFANLMYRGHSILTDSGGIQEEAPSLGKPVLVLRDVTERPEAVAAGTVKVIGTQEAGVVGALEELLHNPQVYEAMARARNPYGDGQASRRIAAALKYNFGLSSTRPEVFKPEP